MAWRGLFKAKQETRAGFGHGQRSAEPRAEPGRAPAERAGSEGEQETNEKRLIEKNKKNLSSWLKSQVLFSVVRCSLNIQMCRERCLRAV